MFIGDDTREDIAYIFDQHPRWQILANELYLKMIQRGMKERYRLGTLTFADNKKCIPLQAADHLAFETYHYMTEPPPFRPAMNRFTSWRQHHGRYFDEAGCLELIDEMKKSGKI